MFATLLGPLPRPPLPDRAGADDLVRAAVEAQVEAGLDPVTDGGQRSAGADGSPASRSQPSDAVGAWRFAAGLTDRLVKPVLAGPYSAGRRDGPAGDATERRARTLELAAAGNRQVRALAAAGCSFIEIHEPEAAAIGSDPAERELFRIAHGALLDGIGPVHASLAITGGNADAAGVATLLAAPYSSLAVDLIDGPDNWRLVARAPSERGIVLGALPVRADTDDGPELLLWAIAYAASTGGRGRQRIGLASASSMAHLAWPTALTKLRRLGEAARLAELPRDELAGIVDPRSLDLRSAALGRYAPRRRRNG
jgi:methionine synthase II (cobalamin-independent)